MGLGAPLRLAVQDRLSLSPTGQPAPPALVVRGCELGVCVWRVGPEKGKAGGR